MTTQTSAPLLLPHLAILDEEDVSGFMTRIIDSRIAGDRKDLLKQLGNKSGRLHWAFPSKLETAVTLFSGSLPSVDEVIQNHTRFPLFSQFLRKPRRNELLQHYKVGCHGETTTAFVPTRRTRLLCCLKCIEADLGDDGPGFAYWRRGHLVSGASYCVVHREPLRTLCEGCELGHRRNRVLVYPRDRCRCGKQLRLAVKPKRVRTEEVLLAVDTMAAQLLQGRCTVPLEPNTIQRFSRNSIFRQGLEGRIALKDVVSERMESVLGKEAMAFLGFAPHSVRGLLRQSESLDSRVDPMQNIALVYSIFGGWEGLQNEISLRDRDPEEYESSCVRAPIRARPQNKTNDAVLGRFNRLSKAEVRGRRSAARAFITNAIHADPTLTRTGLLRVSGGERHHQFALLMDTKWFDKTLPSKSAREPKQPKSDGSDLNEFSPFDLARRVRRVVVQVRSARDLLLRRSPPIRITRTRLLNNTPSESVRGGINAHPKVVEVVEQCMESKADFDLRRIVFVADAVRRISTDCVYGDISTYVGVTGELLNRRLWRARKWIKKHAV